MSVTYNATVKAARLGVVLAAIDGGVGPATLVLGTIGLSGASGILAVITLADPSFALAGATLTLQNLPIGVYAIASGLLERAEIRDSTGTTVVSGLTVAPNGADIQVYNPNIVAGEYVQVQAGSITHP